MRPHSYYPYWSFCNTKKGYSGTAYFTKIKPLNEIYDFPGKDFETKGHILTLEYDDFFLVNCYVLKAQGSLERAECSDFNVPMTESDIYAENQRALKDFEGFQSIERENVTFLLDNGFIDSFRLMHPDKIKFKPHILIRNILPDTYRIGKFKTRP